MTGGHQVQGPTAGAGADTVAALSDAIHGLLLRQQEAFGRTDADAASELDHVSEALERALSLLAAKIRSGDPADPAKIEAIRRTLGTNQAMLARVSDVNRRALHTLFGEPPLYGR